MVKPATCLLTTKHSSFGKNVNIILMKTKVWALSQLFLFEHFFNQDDCMKVRYLLVLDNLFKDI